VVGLLQDETDPMVSVMKVESPHPPRPISPHPSPLPLLFLFLFQCMDSL